MIDDEIYYVTDCEGVLQVEMEGYFQMLSNDKNESVACFISASHDIEKISELINGCGYTFESIIGKKVRITIEEMEEGGELYAGKN